jgi:uncharacterized Zn finger protein
MWYEWRPYVPVAAKRAKAARAIAKFAKAGRDVSPVVIEGRKIAKTFWGIAWCDNLERYSDYANRLPRGRTYVRNGSVVDLQIQAGQVRAMVAGSSLYQVTVEVSPVPKARWKSIRDDCAGAIDSLVELLQGRFSKGVMERICREKTGLFPSPSEIGLSCTCPDWAEMCKHVAAVLYGIGARLDHEPDLLFRLRGVDEGDLIATAGKGLPLSGTTPSKDRVLKEGGLSELFGLELSTPADAPSPKKKRASKSAASRKTKPKAARGKAKPAPRKASKTSSKAKKPKRQPARKKAVPKKAIRRSPSRRT